MILLQRMIPSGRCCCYSYYDTTYYPVVVVVVVVLVEWCDRILYESAYSFVVGAVVVEVMGHVVVIQLAVAVLIIVVAVVATVKIVVVPYCRLWLLLWYYEYV
jgi:hypothetical protein